jgi:hypothetical protein
MCISIELFFKQKLIRENKNAVQACKTGMFRSFVVKMSPHTYQLTLTERYCPDRCLHIMIIALYVRWSSILNKQSSSSRYFGWSNNMFSNNFQSHIDVHIGTYVFQISNPTWNLNLIPIFKFHIVWCLVIKSVHNKCVAPLSSGTLYWTFAITR